MHPESRHLTCTTTPNGIFQWRVRVMGLTNASAQFQQMMDDRLESVANHSDAYIDDILNGSRVEPGEPGEDVVEAHYRDLVELMDTLEKDGFVADIDKSHLFVPEVEWCGHILGKGVRRPSPGRLMAIEKWEVPKTITELRAFLGFTNYYSYS